MREPPAPEASPFTKTSTGGASGDACTTRTSAFPGGVSVLQYLFLQYPFLQYRFLQLLMYLSSIAVSSLSPLRQ